MDPLLQILRRLTECGAEYVLIGGMAAIAHGSPMMTQDADICTTFEEANLVKILAALRPLDPRIRDRPDKMRLPEDIERLEGLKNLSLPLWVRLTCWGSCRGLGPTPKFVAGRSKWT